MKREAFTAKDKKSLSLGVWDEVKSPAGAVVIAHGMAEHIARYEALGKFLNDNGFAALGFDLRAHGETDKGALGLAGKGDLFENSVSDIGELVAAARERYNAPVFLLGHSYGSFLAQRYLARGAEGIDGLILSGSAFQEGPMLNMGYAIARKKVKKGKGDEPGEFFAKLTFRKYDKKTRDGINGWLSRSHPEVGGYNVDPLCGFVCSNGFYESFFKGLRRIAADNFENGGKNLKVLMITGAEDKVSADGKLALKLYRRLLQAGYRPEALFYQGARHEVLNETNRGEVFDDILVFLNAAAGISGG